MTSVISAEGGAKTKTYSVVRRDILPKRRGGGVPFFRENNFIAGLSRRRRKAKEEAEGGGKRVQKRFGSKPFFSSPQGISTEIERFEFDLSESGMFPYPPPPRFFEVRMGRGGGAAPSFLG